MKKICFILLFLVSVAASPELIEQAKKVEKTYSLKNLSKVQKDLENWIAQNSDNDSARYWCARVCLAYCNVERFFRRELPNTKGKDITRPRTAKAAERGIEILSPLLKSRPNWSDLYRIRGELLSHAIVGFLSGMTKGPQALNDLNKSLSTDKSNSFAHVAKAKMYYYNPPIAGGDVDKAISMCKEAVKLGGDDKAYTLLGRSYLKKERPKRAELYLRKALKLNSENIEAQHFLGVALKQK